MVTLFGWFLSVALTSWRYSNERYNHRNFGSVGTRRFVRCNDGNGNIMTKQEAFNEMCIIKDMMEEHASELRSIMREVFPDQYQQGAAYEVFNVTGSSNPYDVSIESLLESIAEENEEVY